MRPGRRSPDGITQITCSRVPSVPQQPIYFQVLGDTLRDLEHVGIGAARCGPSVSQLDMSNRVSYWQEIA
jgi:hypothetical protein